MSQNRDILQANEEVFARIVRKILEMGGFSWVGSVEDQLQLQLPCLLMQKGGYTYCVVIKSSRREVLHSGNILTVAEKLVNRSKERGWMPMFAVGAVLSPSTKACLLGLSIRTTVLDIQNLLYMAQLDREVYDELVACQPYSVAKLTPLEPDYLPLPDYNSDASINMTDYLGKWGHNETPPHGSDSMKTIEIKDFSLENPEDDQEHTPKAAGETTDDYLKDVFGRIQASSALDLGESIRDLKGYGFEGDPARRYYIAGSPGTGKSASAALIAFELLKKEGTDLRKDIEAWQGGKQTNSAAYEKLCTRTLMRLFADDLTLWNEQAKSNADLYRFDLICKIKRDNHKDFWEVAERYFDSKYIIFEFKNYSGKVTQKEVYTTVRYLYPTALRRVAIIISPNGIDDHADKAIRGVLRDEGKLILSLTNAELIHMLQMKEDGEDPADYLSDKLDALLIDLEK